jgi:mannose-6-phosphate isomerase-like protein (cupin superfamily)
MRTLPFTLFCGGVLGLTAGLGLSLTTTARATAAASSAVLISAERTQAAFAKGEPLVETPAYKVHASRREAPGMAEVHTLDTDIIYVLEGTATIVTGGTAVDARAIAPNELRGVAIAGGEARRLAKGDVLIVPNGVPHWFKDVQGPFLYYVVKTTSDGAGGAE